MDTDRPELDRLMKDAARHWFDVVLVWKLDRFGRSVGEFTQQCAALSSLGIPFIATSQGPATGRAKRTPNASIHHDGGGRTSSVS